LNATVTAEAAERTEKTLGESLSAVDICVLEFDGAT